MSSSSAVAESSGCSGAGCGAGNNNNGQQQDGDQQQRRFEIKKWNAVALWSWDIHVDICAICRNHIMDLCLECQNSNNTGGGGSGGGNKTAAEEDCTVAWGVCNHAFHNHCISRWLRTRNVCPLDNREWEYLKLGK